MKQVFTFNIITKSKITTYKWFQAYSTPNNRNVLISPIGLKLVLALLYEGSGGLTEKEFQNVLQFPIDKKNIRDNFERVLSALQVLKLIVNSRLNRCNISAKRTQPIYFKLRYANILRFSSRTEAELRCESFT